MKKSDFIRIIFLSLQDQKVKYQLTRLIKKKIVTEKNSFSCFCYRPNRPNGTFRAYGTHGTCWSNRPNWNYGSYRTYRTNGT